MSAAVHTTDPSFESELTATGPAPPRAVAVRAMFRGVTTHARILTFPERAGKQAGSRFTIGWQAGVDAPVANDYVPWAAHPLVLPAGKDYVVNVTPQMTGEVREGGIVYSLAAYTERRGRTFALPPSGQATLECGASQFVIARTAPPRALPAPAWRWSWQRHGYTLAAGVALAMLLVMAAFVPSDPKALALDIYGRDGRMLSTLIKPPVPEEPPPEWLKKTGQDAGGKGSLAAGAAGAAGDKNAPQRDARFSVKRRANENEVRLTKEQAADAIRQRGLIGVFSRIDSTPLNAILSEEKAMGDAAEDVIGHLQGNTIASAYGAGGLSVTGSGAGAAGTGIGLRGHGGLQTVGEDGDGTGPGHRYGSMAGTLNGRRPKVPDIITGITTVRGALDKEIVRRVVRRHLNEVKFCYEQELVRKPSLGGRVVVNFAIAGSGQVLTSVLQSSTVGNTSVEHCTVQAVKRWQFPAPEGGGLVTVTYPFVLTPAGG